MVSGEIEVSYVEIDEKDCFLVTYCLTDIYANEFWSDALKF